jgi:hypothetical protein
MNKRVNIDAALGTAAAAGAVALVVASPVSRAMTGSGVRSFAESDPGPSAGAHPVTIALDPSVKPAQCGPRYVALTFDDGYKATLDALPKIVDDLAGRGLCAGQIVPSRSPTITSWDQTYFAMVAHR